MKPYYQDKYATIYLGDCLELLPDMPKVDLVLTDPIWPNNSIKEFAKINPFDLFSTAVKLFDCSRLVYHLTHHK